MATAKKDEPAQPVEDLNDLNRRIAEEAAKVTTAEAKGIGADQPTGDQT